MNRIFNFNAGPSTLPLPVLERARDEFVEFQGTGMSIVEMSHRAKPYEEVHLGAMALIRELLDLPEHYKVLFLGGGATLQFAMVPMNLLLAGRSCDFTVAGSWAKKACEDAQKIGRVNVIFDGKPDNYLNLPDPASLVPDPGAAYLHLTANETIGGVQWQSFPDAGDVPIVCDMSSDFLSRRFPVEQFGLIYAGAQKNVGPAGVTVVLIRDDMLERCADTLPAYLDYRTHAESDSLYNTPPVFALYMVKLVLEHLKAAGGLAAAEKWADERSGIVYDAIARNGEFYSCPVPPHCRSKMNVVFRLPSEDLEKQFLGEATAAGMEGLKGHRSVGGCRASLYNAMPIVGAEALAQLMAEFAARNG
jgi:phosphoserine aminotransferase